MSEWVGWTATAAFSASYFCRSPETLRRVQAIAALIWLSYGVLIQSPPVIVANVIVATLAISSSFKRKKDADVTSEAATALPEVSQS